MQLQATETIGSPEMLARTGATYRQLDHWCRTGLVRCVDPRPGSGAQRAFWASEVALVRALVTVHGRGKDAQNWRSTLIRRHAWGLREAIRRDARYAVLTDDCLYVDEVPPASGLLIRLDCST